MTIPLVPVIDPVPLRSATPEPDFRADVEGFLGELPAFSVALNATSTAMNTDVATVTTNTSQVLVAASAVAAQYSAFMAADPGGLGGSSTTSVAIGTGSKSFTASTGKLWGVGQILMIRSIVSPANYLIGDVTSYNSTSGALVINVLYAIGSGTFASWDIVPSNVTRPYSLIGSIPTTSGTVWTLNPLPLQYNDIYIEIAGFSHSGAGTTNFRVEFYDGATWSVGINLTGTTVAAADTITAGIKISAYNLLTAMAATSIAAGTLSTISTSAGIKGIRFTTVAGYTGDAGVIRFWGV